MRFSDARGFKVVSKATAETVGRIADYIIDPTAGAVAALVLNKTTVRGDTLPWADVAAFGDDAVIVASEDAVVEASGALADLSDKRHHAQGKRVLSTDGVELGNLSDVGFDTATGAITSIDFKDGSLEEPKLLAIGSYAVIVRA